MQIIPIAIGVSAAVVTVAVILGIGICLWRVQRRRIQRIKSRMDREERERVLKPSTPTSSRAGGSKHKSPSKQAWIYDKRYGEGVPSAPPDGYYEDPPDWMQDLEQGKTSRHLRPKAEAWTEPSPADEDASDSEDLPRTDRKHRRAHTEKARPSAERERSKRSARARNLAPGTASATRAAWREGKSGPNGETSDSDEEEDDLPGQASSAYNSRHFEQRQTSGSWSPNPRSNVYAQHDKESSRSTPCSSPTGRKTAKEQPSASPPSGTSSGQKEEDKRQQSAKESPPSSPPHGSGTSHKEEDKSNTNDHSGTGATDARVAADVAASPEAADLIAVVDKELDQTQGKDLEWRRRNFKNLLLKWHPDKNTSEPRAAEVFRYLMGRRGRYLEA